MQSAAEGDWSKIRELLQGLGALLAVGGCASAAAAGADASRAAISACVASLAQSSGSRPVYSYSMVDGQIDSFLLWRSGLRIGQSLDVRFDITSVAQQGTVLLSMGTDYLSLYGWSEVTFEVGGNRGTASVTLCCSGVSMWSIAGAINGLRSRTGVQAIASATSVQLLSERHGPNAFVSVQVLSNFWFNQNSGFYLMDGDGFPDVTSRVPLNSCGVVANGSDLEGQICGEPAAVQGNCLILDTAALGARVCVDPDFTHATTGGLAFRATRVH
jgi:hypothetical protein